MSCASAPASSANRDSVRVSRSDCDPVAATYGNTSLRLFDREVYQHIALVHGERARLGGRTVDEDAVASTRDMALDQMTIGVEIDRAVLKGVIRGGNEPLSQERSLFTRTSTPRGLYESPACAPSNAGGFASVSCHRSDSCQIWNG